MHSPKLLTEAQSFARFRRRYNWTSAHLLVLFLLLFFSISSRSFEGSLLPALLKLEAQQVGLRTADRRRAVAFPGVKRLAAFVEGVDEFFALVLVVAVFREAVCETARSEWTPYPYRFWIGVCVTLDGTLGSVGQCRRTTNGTERERKVLTAREWHGGSVARSLSSLLFACHVVRHVFSA